MDDGAILGALHNNRAELFRCGETANCTDTDLVLLVWRSRRLSNLARGYLHVLVAKRIDHVIRRQASLGEFGRIQPDAHCVFALAKDHHVADALYALQRVAHVDIQVIADEQRVVLPLVSVKTEHHDERTGVLIDRDPGLLHDTGQPAHHGGGAVVDVNGCDVQVAIQIEDRGYTTRSVVAAAGADIPHALGAIDGALQESSDAGFYSLRICARIVRVDGYRGRGQVGKLRHRQCGD